MKQELEQTVATAVKELFGIDVQVELARPDEQFGDYATNMALQLAKQVGKNPREIAEALRDKLASNGQLQSVTVAGPGFLNLTLTDQALAESLRAMPAKTLAGKKVLVEYSDPNPLKPLHAGHLYTTLVGDTIARLIENAGAETIRLNYGGDVGRHIGISLWAIIHELGGEYPEKLSEIPEADRPAWLGARYVEGTAAFEDDEHAKQEITELNKRVYQLQADGDHESPFAQIYWTVRGWSYDYFKTLYDQLQVHPFDRFIPESEVFELGLSTVREQLAKGVYAESQGAVIFEGEHYGLHTRVFINSAGLPTYETKDVGLLLRKWDDYHFDESIVITANEQAQYYEVMLKSVEQYAPEPVGRSKHLTHGIVKLQGGVKMSSRRGNIVTALEILDAARAAGKETGTDPSEDTILAAVKYAFAKNRIGGDIAYDPKESIALEGNSGPYLQYAHARARSILARASESPHPTGDQLRSDAHVPVVRSASVLAAHPVSHGATEALNGGNLEAGERSLLRKITEYSEVVEKATSELMPHHICTYLYELAQTFNSFYEHNRVIGSGEREAVRLKLVENYADTLKNGLTLLGITAPERM
jgi:arginyl-tRNA synthetase